MYGESAESSFIALHTGGSSLVNRRFPTDCERPLVADCRRSQFECRAFPATSIRTSGPDRGRVKTYLNAAISERLARRCMCLSAFRPRVPHKTKLGVYET